MGPFFPFDPPYNWKNQNFEKMKKNPGNIIILHSCTTNSRHMMYGSWDIKCDWHNFLLFWAIFLPFYPAPANNAENLNFEKIKKASRGIITLYISTINKKKSNDVWFLIWSTTDRTFSHFAPTFTLFTMIIGHNVLEIWCVTDVIVVFHFGKFFALLPPQQSQKWTFQKKEKKAWRYHHFT